MYRGDGHVHMCSQPRWPAFPPWVVCCGGSVAPVTHPECLPICCSNTLGKEVSSARPSHEEPHRHTGGQVGLDFGLGFVWIMKLWTSWQ